MHDLATHRLFVVYLCWYVKRPNTDGASGEIVVEQWPANFLNPMNQPHFAE